MHVHVHVQAYPRNIQRRIHKSQNSTFGAFINFQLLIECSLNNGPLYCITVFPRKWYRLSSNYSNSPKIITFLSVRIIRCQSNILVKGCSNNQSPLCMGIVAVSRNKLGIGAYCHLFSRLGSGFSPEKGDTNVTNTRQLF